MDEATRQRAVLDAIAAPGGDAFDAVRERGTRAARGLEAYRANAEGSAARALGAAFGTVRQLVGSDDFAQLARAFWREQPPRRGDLGEWGEGFADWLQAHAALAPWPYLADCARLDLALHRCERAADAALDTASLRLLGSTDPAQLRLVSMPGVALLHSPWPIVAIHRAHQLDGAAATRAFAELRDAIARPHAEAAWVTRDGWRAVVEPLAGADLDWTESVLAGATLADAFERAGPAFDFAAWLQQAIRRAWLQAVVVVTG